MMAEYIDRAAALSFPFANGEYDHEHADKHFIYGCETYKEWLEQLPAADVAPVVHAHWTIEDIYTYELSYGTTAYEPVYECSACKRLAESYLRLDEPIMPVDADFPRYCPNCGAKMDEEDEDDV